MFIFWQDHVMVFAMHAEHLIARVFGEHLDNRGRAREKKEKTELESLTGGYQYTLSKLGHW